MKWTLQEFYKDKISDEEAQDQLNLLDNNGDGEISYTEWRKFIHKHILKILLHWFIFIIQYKFKYGILGNGIKLDYGIQMLTTGIFTI